MSVSRRPLCPCSQSHASALEVEPCRAPADNYPPRSEVKAYKSKEVDVAKLFAKHFKLADHIAYLEKTKVGIAVGTPNRVGKLLEPSTATETTPLGLTFLSHIVLDASHLDSKQRSLLDMPEAREDLFRHVLGNKAVVARAREGKVKFVIY